MVRYVPRANRHGRPIYPLNRHPLKWYLCISDMIRDMIDDYLCGIESEGELG